MTVKILYFSWIREMIGVGEEDVVLSPDMTSARALLTWLATQTGAHAAAFADQEKLRCAVDHVMADLDAPLLSPKEIAFFPPVTGG